MLSVKANHKVCSDLVYPNHFLFNKYSANCILKTKKLDSAITITPIDKNEQYFFMQKKHFRDFWSNVVF